MITPLYTTFDKICHYIHILEILKIGETDHYNKILACEMRVYIHVYSARFCTTKLYAYVIKCTRAIRILRYCTLVPRSLTFCAKYTVFTDGSAARREGKTQQLA